MKKKHLLVLALVGAGGYLLYKHLGKPPVATHAIRRLPQGANAAEAAIGEEATSGTV
jgi:DMSO reductase anchor subunit